MRTPGHTIQMSDAPDQRHFSFLGRVGVVITLALIVFQISAVADFLEIVIDKSRSAHRDAVYDFHFAKWWSVVRGGLLPIVVIPFYSAVYFIFNGGVNVRDKKLSKWLYISWAISAIGGIAFYAFTMSGGGNWLLKLIPLPTA